MSILFLRQNGIHSLPHTQKVIKKRNKIQFHSLESSRDSVVFIFSQNGLLIFWKVLEMEKWWNLRARNEYTKRSFYMLKKALGKKTPTTNIHMNMSMNMSIEQYPFSTDGQHSKWLFLLPKIRREREKKKAPSEQTKQTHTHTSAKERRMIWSEWKSLVHNWNGTMNGESITNNRNFSSKWVACALSCVSVNWFCVREAHSIENIRMRRRHSLAQEFNWLIGKMSVCANIT